MYNIKTTNKFEKDFAKCAKRNLDLDMLGEVVEILERSGKLARSYQPHILSGSYKGYWECHIKPDWLLIWRQNDQIKVIELVEREHILICLNDSPLSRINGFKEEV